MYPRKAESPCAAYPADPRPTHCPQAFRIIEQDLGKPLGDLFSSISEYPIAAASIGQVSAGTSGGRATFVAYFSRRCSAFKYRLAVFSLVDAP